MCTGYKEYKINNKVLNVYIYYIGHQRYKPQLKELLRYSDHMAPCWRHIALELDILDEVVEKINVDYPSVNDKCYGVFYTWLKRSTNNKLCWCRIVNAFKMAGLVDVAEQIEKDYFGMLIIITIYFFEAELRQEF